MIRILFVCYGNICRSPMAEFVFRDLAKKRGLENAFSVESRACYHDEIGSQPHEGTRKILAAKGIDCSGKRAELLQKEDYNRFDYIIGMDNPNIARMRRVFANDPKNKLSMMMDYTARPGEVADPWYTGDFETTYNDIYEGCSRLLEYLIHKENIPSGR